MNVESHIASSWVILLNAEEKKRKNTSYTFQYWFALGIFDILFLRVVSHTTQLIFPNN